MRMIISPAKKMNVESDLLGCQGLPVFLEDTRKLMHWVQELSFEEARKLWGCNEKIAELNFDRFSHMNLERNLTPALISYEGIQYQYMAPAVFSDLEWEYVQEHLRILSGFYGVLKPLDGVTPYRLEMQAKAKVDGTASLYDFLEIFVELTAVFLLPVIFPLIDRDDISFIRAFHECGHSGF